MTKELLTAIGSIIGRMPEWMRHDIVSKDPTVRTRAEEALAAMIATAIEVKPSEDEQQPNK